MQRLKEARLNALKVLSSYPDYGKATEGYSNGIVEAFAQFDEGIQIQLAHITLGLRARHSFLPTIENVNVLARELLADRARKSDLEKRFSGKRVTFAPELKRPNPAQGFYPKLTQALGRDAELLTGLTFDEIHDIAKLQATRGNEAARRQLQSLKTEAKRKAA